MPPSASHNDEGSLLKDALRSLTRFVSRRPKITLWFVVLLAFAALSLTVRTIKFKTDRSDLIDREAAFQKRWIDYTESFGDASDIVVVVQADDPETIKQVLDDLGSRLLRESDLFANVLYKIEPGLLREKGLQYLSPEQLETGLEHLAQFRPILAGRLEVLKLEYLIPRLRLQLESSRDNRRNELKPVLEHSALLAGSMADYLEDRNEFHSPWPDLMAVEPRRRDEANQVTYFLNDSGSLGLLKTFPRNRSGGFDGDTESIERLREIIADVSSAFPRVTIGVTGIPVLENDEMRRSQSDMLKASFISFVGVGLLLVLGFRGFRHPLLALLMLAVGMAWSFGYTTLSVGHLNILSVSFAAILIGLGIDFGIHYLSRYLELRHEGLLLRPALLETSSSVGTGIVTAAVTTALAFFCATFTPFVGVAELGVIAGGGILLCALATFVVLPALIAISDQHVEPKKLPTPFEGTVLRRLTARFPLVVFLVSFVDIVGIGSQTFKVQDGRFSLRVRYDYNLLNLQADGLESVEVQKRIFRESHDSLLFAVSMAEGPAEARALRKKFEQLPSVYHVEELGSRLPAFPSAETKLLVQAFRAQLARLPQQPSRATNVDPATIGHAIEQFYLSIRGIDDADALSASRSLDTFLNRLSKLSARQQAAFLSDYQYRMQSALLDQLTQLRDAANPEPITLADLPSELTSRFVSRGKWLVQIYPAEQIWDIEPLSRFISDIRAVDPDVTGTPLQNFEASRQIKASYEAASLYALAVIGVVLLIDFLGRDHKLLTMLTPLAVIGFAVMTLQARRIDPSPAVLVGVYVGMTAAIAAILDFRNFRDAVLAMVPPLGGGLLMFGLFGLLGIDLNPANLIVLPLVLGIGVDDGVHVVHDFRMQTGRYRTSSSTINAIVLTSLTSMIGFGSMMVAAHRGLYSVGLVLVVGVGSCLLVSLVTLPAILTLISRGESDGETAAEDQDGPPMADRSQTPAAAQVA